ncbi:MAG: hypothetical protein ACXVUE_22135 [Solirubrobacteraceae bacterium]
MLSAGKSAARATGQAAKEAGKSAATRARASSDGRKNWAPDPSFDQVHGSPFDASTHIATSP